MLLLSSVKFDREMMAIQAAWQSSRWASHDVSQIQIRLLAVTATSSASRGESRPVPADKGLGLDHSQHGEGRREPAVKLEEEPTTAIGQRDPTFDLAPQDHDLVQEQRVFGEQLLFDLNGEARTASKNDSSAIIAEI